MWPSNAARPTIPTPRSRRLVVSRLERRRRALEAALQAMEAGAALTHGRVRRVSQWALNGRLIPDDIAAMILANPNVVGDSDTLFPGTFSQAYRYRRHG